MLGYTAIDASESDVQRWEEALRKAEDGGIKVLWADDSALKNIAFGGCPPTADHGDPANYQLSSWFADRPSDSDLMIIPGDYRTTAATTGASDYIYWGEGDWSWAIPYVADLAALSWQVDPDLPFDDFIELLWATSTDVRTGERVVNPTALLHAVQERASE